MATGRAGRERREERAAKGGEDDIQALLAQVALHDKKVREVEVIENCAPPSPRCNCTFTSLGNHVMAGARRPLFCTILLALPFLHHTASLSEAVRHAAHARDLSQ